MQNLCAREPTKGVDPVFDFIFDLLPETTWTAMFVVVLSLAYTVWLVLKNHCDSEASIYISPGAVLTTIQVIDWIALLVSIITIDAMAEWMFIVTAISALLSIGLMSYIKRANRMESKEIAAKMRLAAQQLRELKARKRAEMQEAAAQESEEFDELEATEAETPPEQPSRPSGSQPAKAAPPRRPLPYVSGRKGDMTLVTQMRSAGLPPAFIE
jgi:hypothetical protein